MSRVPVTSDLPSLIFGTKMFRKKKEPVWEMYMEKTKTKLKRWKCAIKNKALQKKI